jgi:hypothetical protein
VDVGGADFLESGFYWNSQAESGKLKFAGSGRYPLETGGISSIDSLESPMQGGLSLLTDLAYGRNGVKELPWVMARVSGLAKNGCISLPLLSIIR